MVRGRKPNLDLEVTPQLRQQREFRAKRTARITELEEDNAKLRDANEALTNRIALLEKNLADMAREMDRRERQWYRLRQEQESRHIQTTMTRPQRCCPSRKPEPFEASTTPGRVPLSDPPLAESSAPTAYPYPIPLHHYPPLPRHSDVRSVIDHASPRLESTLQRSVSRPTSRPPARSTPPFLPPSYDSSVSFSDSAPLVPHISPHVSSSHLINSEPPRTAARSSCQPARKRSRSSVRPSSSDQQSSSSPEDGMPPQTPRHGVGVTHNSESLITDARIRASFKEEECCLGLVSCEPDQYDDA